MPSIEMTFTNYQPVPPSEQEQLSDQSQKGIIKLCVKGYELTPFLLQRGERFLKSKNTCIVEHSIEITYLNYLPVSPLDKNNSPLRARRALNVWL